MKKVSFLALASLIFFGSCAEQAKKSAETVEAAAEKVMEKAAPAYDTSDPKTILASIAHAHGGWGDLWSKKDVEYVYEYRQADGKADISTERYIFSNEASFAKYTQHDVNVMPDHKGDVMQHFDGETTKVMADGKEMEDPQVVGVGDFLRRANYFWFTMPYKLGDDGINADYMGQEEYNGVTYDKVNVTYDASVTGKEQNDTYVLYVNPDTKMVDRFYFSIPFMGLNDPLIIANYQYENIDGQKIATKRTYFMPSPDGYGDEPSLVQTLTNVKFNNGFTNENIGLGL